MSVQFGKCNFDGRPVDLEDFAMVRSLLAPYGPDGESYLSREHVGILYRVFHTTHESRREKQPQVLKSGSVLTWDGRLDNREDLIAQLRGELSTESVDSAIVAAAYELWDTNCLGKLVGDWALSLWDPRKQSLILAKDFIGTRHLYYTVKKDQVTWCTILDPLVLSGNQPFELQEEYIAGWLASFPAPHLTPYADIHSVPPAAYVRFRQGKAMCQKHWDFDPGQRIRYRTDGEYEEHFRMVFSQAVRRRLRSDSPIIAELSGGMDSSAIVCVADDIIARGEVQTPRLDTVSYYNESEPNWNERPYFETVEEKRGRAGFHIETGWALFRNNAEGFPLLVPDSQGLSEATRVEFTTCISTRENRCILSGIGGDEFCGGVPTPIPELTDLLARVRLTLLSHRLKAWALSKRQPWWHLLLATIGRFLPPTFVPRTQRPPLWLCPSFVRRNKAVLSGYETRLKVGRALPSFQENLSAVQALRRQLASFIPRCAPPLEYRYPFLDRTLLEFLMAIPREQMVRPGQRRSLMRRALAGTIPREVLNRKRKAFISRAPSIAVSNRRNEFVEGCVTPLCAALGIFDRKSFCGALHEVHEHKTLGSLALIRGLSLEYWLRDLCDRGILCIAANHDISSSDVLRTPGKEAVRTVQLADCTNAKSERR